MEQQGPSSPQGNLPLGVDPSELYDGPRPNGQAAPVQQQPQVVQHPRAQMAQAPQVDPRALMRPIPPQMRSGQMGQVTSSADRQAEIISTGLSMVSARLIGLLALLAACAIWGYVIYDPNTQRTVAATIFSVTVFFPAILLYWRDYWKTM